MTGSVTGMTPKPVTLPGHARCRFQVSLDTISAPAPKLSDSHQAIIAKILTDLDYALPEAGFTAGRIITSFEPEGNRFMYSVYCPLIRIPSNGTPADKTDVILNRLTAIICEHAKGLTIDGSISPTSSGEVLSYEQAIIPNPNFDGVRISLRFDQFSIR